jgi:replicative DNA helicase
LDNIEKSVLIYLFNKFNVNIIKLINPEYFTNQKYRIIFECFLEYKKDSAKWNSSYRDLYNYYESYYKIKKGLEDVVLNPFDFKEIMESESLFDAGWYEKIVKSWLQNKTVEEKLIIAVDKLKKKNITDELDDVFNVLDSCMKKMYDIKNLDTYNEFGIDLTDYNSYNNNTVETFSCGYPFLDKSVNGGMSKKTMWLFLGQPKVGKSIWLSNVAANLVLLGKNVVYVTLELDELEVLSRIGANLFSFNVKDYLKFSKERLPMFINKVKEFQSGKIYKKRFIDNEKLEETNIVSEMIGNSFELLKMSADDFINNKKEESEDFSIENDEEKENNLIKPGKIFIKEFPTSSLTTEELEIFIKNLEDRKKIKIDVVVLDYMNIMKTKNDKSDNLYSKIKYVSEELRGIAVRNELCLVTATQVNRGSFEKEDITMSSISESAGGLHTADVVFGIIQTPELKSSKKYRLKVLLTRRGANTGAIKEFNINYPQMRITELEKEEEYITNDYIYERLKK